MSQILWSSNKIRQQFLDFFKERKHQIVPSAPLVLKNDPTLMFTNAGMNQFKDYFLGYKKPEYKRVADTQKCLRVSGKHNDLEDVGFDTYHHTMFEMLGNWSFGDYFKKDAIAWAWELLTEVFGIPKDQLYVTIFEGDQEDGLKRDQEAYDFWKSWIDEDRIIDGNKKDNFWEMGDTGPCGPCSEIHVDIRPKSEREKIDGRSLVNQDHPQVVEIWNLVFMQFNRLANKSLEPLSENHIDTGMGFERLCMVLQGKTSSYDTDIFVPLISKIENLSNHQYQGSMDMSDVAVRVIVDHIRAISFAIADGQLPSNTGAGYVIRRILRRAVRYGYSFLDFREPFLFQLVPILAQVMGEAFPELRKQQELIENVIKEEEQSFLRTLESGLKRLENINTDITGEQAFELYDTFGFPFDLTKLIANEKGLQVDEKGFEEQMELQKKRSQQDAKMEVGDWTIFDESPTEFIGYDELESTVRINRYRTVIKKDKQEYQLVFNRTPFYAESGGQIGDSGILEIGDETIPIFDTKKENDLIIHFAKSLPKAINTTGEAKVNKSRRQAIEKNHTATHLLHAALRDILGKHVEQKGSLVSDEKLRFDFSHYEKVEDDKLKQIEDLVNLKIAQNVSKIENRHMSYDEAIRDGAMALFGEKYGKEVRVIAFDPNYSMELCGGCHVETTAQLQLFKISSESGISAGVRRIEAITSNEAIKYYQQQEQTVRDIDGLLHGDKNVFKAVQALVLTNQELESRLAQFTQKQAGELKNQLLDEIQNLGHINFIGEVVNLDDADAIKNIAFELRNEVKNLVLVLGSEVNGKALLTVMISDNLVKNENLNASLMIKTLAKEIQGGGGGQPFYATAGGKNVAGLKTAVEMARSLVYSDEPDA